MHKQDEASSNNPQFPFPTVSGCGGAATGPIYEIGSPIFDKVIIHLDKKYYGGDKFVIEAKNNSEKNRYIQSATLDGKPLNKAWFYHSQLVNGGRLVLQMGPEPPTIPWIKQGQL